MDKIAGRLTSFAAMSADNWRDQLQRARTAEDVVSTAREFLSHWSSHQLGALPVHCQPLRMSDADDLSIYALTLVRAQCDDHAHTAELHAMATFFAAASQRLSQIFALARKNKSPRLFNTK